MKKLLAVSAVLVLAAVVLSGCGQKSAPHLLNVSYDPTRELYKDINERFVKDWEAKTGEAITVEQSHGGSGSQGMSVINGLNADVVTLALAYDIDAIVENTNPPLLKKDWQKQFKNNSCPYTSTIVFLVRKGNPKNIKDWNDLIDRDDIKIVTPNPKTSGGARWNYLAAWGYVLEKELGDLAVVNDPTKAEQVAKANETAKAAMGKMFNSTKVPVMDKGARGATNTFVQNGIGDVLLAWENEALLYLQTSPNADIEIVVPSISIVAEPPVAVVDKNVDAKGTRKIAEAYLNYLYEPQIQDVVAKHFYRPSDSEAAKRNADKFPQVKLFKIDDVFGGWAKAQKEHFSDGGTFDQIMK